MPPEVKKVRELMRRLPIEDRLACLLIAIVDNDSAALNVSTRLTFAVERLTMQQNAANRFKVSTTLRDLADRLEHPALSHVV
jgi:hypothetical protein